MKNQEKIKNLYKEKIKKLLKFNKAYFDKDSPIVSDSDFDDAIKFLNTQLSLNLMTEDAMEGVAAFMQRREPNWKGR